MYLKFKGITSILQNSRLSVDNRQHRQCFVSEAVCLQSDTQKSRKPKASKTISFLGFAEQHIKLVLKKNNNKKNNFIISWQGDD